MNGLLLFPLPPRSMLFLRRDNTDKGGEGKGEEIITTNFRLDGVSCHCLKQAGTCTLELVFVKRCRFQ